MARKRFAFAHEQNKGACSAVPVGRGPALQALGALAVERGVRTPRGVGRAALRARVARAALALEVLRPCGAQQAVLPLCTHSSAPASAVEGDQASAGRRSGAHGPRRRPEPSSPQPSTATTRCRTPGAPPAPSGRRSSPQSPAPRTRGHRPRGSAPRSARGPTCQRPCDQRRRRQSSRLSRSLRVGGRSTCPPG